MTPEYAARENAAFCSVDAGINRPSIIAPYHDQIVAMRDKRMTTEQIAKAIGQKPATLRSYIHRHGIRKPDPKRHYFKVPVGKMDWSINFNKDQLREIEAEAEAEGCETLCEWAVEIIRDYLAEKAATR